MGVEHASETLDDPCQLLDKVSPEVAAILREHPLLETAWSKSARQAGFDLTSRFIGGNIDRKSFAANLATSSLKLGDERLATPLHRFLVAGKSNCLLWFKLASVAENRGILASLRSVPRRSTNIPLHHRYPTEDLEA